MTTHTWRAQSIYKIVQAEHNDSQMFITAGTEECTVIANSPFSTAKQFCFSGQRVKKYLPAQHACSLCIQQCCKHTTCKDTKCQHFSLKQVLVSKTKYIGNLSARCIWQKALCSNIGSSGASRMAPLNIN